MPLFSTYKKFNYTADVYGYTLITSPDGTTTEREYEVVPQNYAMQVTTSFAGDLVILSNAKFQRQALILELKDRNGNEIYNNGAWEISSTQPITNALGLIDGYKYKAKLIQGDTTV